MYWISKCKKRTGVIKRGEVRGGGGVFLPCSNNQYIPMGNFHCVKHLYSRGKVVRRQTALNYWHVGVVYTYMYKQEKDRHINKETVRRTAILIDLDHEIMVTRSSTKGHISKLKGHDCPLSFTSPTSLVPRAPSPFLRTYTGSRDLKITA